MKTAVQSKEVREALLDATERILSSSGYKKMTIDQLATEVGIGKGSVYLHFPSKEEIALSHIDRIIERLKAEMTSIAERDIPLADRLRLMLLARVLFRFDSVQHYTQSLNDLLAAIRPKLLARRKGYFDEEAKLIAGVIAEGIADGTFSAADADEAAEILVLATNTLLPFSLTTRELGERSEIESKMNRLTALLLEGLLKR